VQFLVLDGSQDFCDRCGEAVPPQNDVREFDALLMDNPVILFVGHSRHILPVVKDGAVTCPGSPSRAQYIEGQPPDPRARYAYDPKSEERYRTAWRRLQAKVD